MLRNLLSYVGAYLRSYCLATFIEFMAVEFKVYEKKGLKWNCRDTRFLRQVSSALQANTVFSNIQQNSAVVKLGGLFHFFVHKNKEINICKHRKENLFRILVQNDFISKFFELDPVSWNFYLQSY